MTDRRRVFAIGLDSLDSKLTRRLIDEGAMPNLAALLEEGRWADVGSVQPIGSGAVWPTFVTGTDPKEHGQYGEWRWDPQAMDVRRFDDEGLTPFWYDLVRAGTTVGIFDVPFAPFIGIEKGFEINEWGAHDVLRGTMQASPASARQILARHGNHPFESEPPIPESAYRRQDLEFTHKVSVEGVHKRGRVVRSLLEAIDPQLTVIVFPEFHHAAHFLWHSIEAEHPLFADARLQEAPNLLDVCTAIDEEVGILADRLTPGDTLMVFSLHGMRPSLGVPNMIGAFLRSEGLAVDASWSSRTWRERRVWALATFKRAAPGWLKDVYHRRATLMTQIKLARSTMQEQYDWSRTSAIALPTDQHGWARVNVTGREREGVVQPGDYEALVNRIEDAAKELRTDAGEDLVDSVVLASDGEDPRTIQIPDVIVHWADAAFPDEMRPADPTVYSEKVAGSRTGQHNADAFCIVVGEGADGLPDHINTAELSRFILARVVDR